MLLVVGVHARGEIKGYDLIEMWESMWHHEGGLGQVATWEKPPPSNLQSKGLTIKFAFSLILSQILQIFPLPNSAIFPLICEELETLNPPFHLLSKT